MSEDTKATPIGPGDPVEHPALSQMGGTFAERAAAAKKAEPKAVKADEAEDKAVKTSATKSRSTRKK